MGLRFKMRHKIETEKLKIKKIMMHMMNVPQKHWKRTPLVVHKGDHAAGNQTGNTELASEALTDCSKQKWPEEVDSSWQRTI